MERWLVQYQIQERCVEGLYDEEEDLFQWDVEQCRPHNYIRWISPYAMPYQIRIPWYGRDNSDLRSG